jgi:hypothetical protein
MSRPRETARHHADPDHDVITVEGGQGAYRRRPCGGCPWRVDQTGGFPAQAFAISANTAEDMATHTFACHEAGAERPAVCAGFLLRGAEHNMAVRMRYADGRIDPDQVSDGGHALHGDYVEMAVANGLDEDDPSLARCRRGSYHTDPEES